MSVVEMVVERYSTDGERDRLMKALMEKGPEKLLDTLQSLGRVGGRNGARATKTVI